MLVEWNRGFWSNDMMGLKEKEIKTHNVILIFLVTLAHIFAAKAENGMNS
jgi:hypothetical protein